MGFRVTGPAGTSGKSKAGGRRQRRQWTGRDWVMVTLIAILFVIAVLALIGALV
jgi:hypothetical protein